MFEPMSKPMVEPMLWRADELVAQRKHQSVTHHRRLAWITRGVVAAVGVAMMCGCKDLTNDPGLPAGTPDPSFYHTADGARGLRTAAMFYLNTVIPKYVVESGLLSDELVDRYTGSTVSQTGRFIPDPLDERLLPDGAQGDPLKDGTASYAELQTVRGAANIALGALAAYDTTAAHRAAQQGMRGELYAVEGYAEILLAELFCSGVPLSTLDFQQDFTYRPSSTASQVYADATTKLDSAIILAAATDSVVNLAKVLQGRAQLALGQYRAAADDVSSVPTAFQYRATIRATTMSTLLINGVYQPGTVADREGGNGLPFLSSGDPRAAVTTTCSQGDYRCPSNSLTMPAKYFDPSVITSAGYAPFVVANGIEARLIQAEAALQASPNSPQWLTILNTLRTDGTTTGPGQWNAGTGGVSGLAPLADSAATMTSARDSGAARVAELFHERAYWLFATGHRQGDLRRLIRQYGSEYPQFQSDQRVYPTGVYNAPGNGRYGTDVTAPIPTTEYNNPNYHGCIDRNA